MAFEDFGIQMEEDPLEKEDYEQPSSGRQTKIYLKSMFHGYYEELEGSTLEENVEGGYEESPGYLCRDKATPFSGVVKFFSNMTDVAHKPSETVLWDSAIGGHQCHHPKALQATCSFEMSIEGEKMPGQALAGPCTIVDLASTTSAV
ncbi:Cytokine Receptor-Like Factor 1 [Manis pentadactyla]|nr:Cytokine Receptor-Like Factor 1 [Manis pentadactyla]